MAFLAAKTALCQMVHLCTLCQCGNLPHGGTSNEHVSAALQPLGIADSSVATLGIFLRKLEPAQTRYSAFDCKSWLYSAGIRHFCHMLEGCKFFILTDHKFLTHALDRSSDQWKPWHAGSWDTLCTTYISDIRISLGWTMLWLILCHGLQPRLRHQHRSLPQRFFM